MRHLKFFLGAVVLVWATVAVAYAAPEAPTVVQMPGTQPGEVSTLEAPTKCDNCHGGYDVAIEPAHNWRGSMMAQATRDPIFWATVALAEQDFDGSGDLCIRCHSPDGWLSGRSTPTDGSHLSENDAFGVSCDLCHTLTNPDGMEYLGEQFAPFIAYSTEPHYGSGQYVVWGGSEKLGPYDDAEARHQFLPSQFHRSSDLCGTCHDVSNPVVGDLAHNNGAQVPLAAGNFGGVLGAPVGEQAAFKNPPYAYGIVERTYSEHVASWFYERPLSDFANLPADLQAGAILEASSVGDYADGTVRTFSCQTCHMPPVNGPGCNKQGVPIRADLPLHDLTGGNYWMPEAIQYLDNLGLLVIGGGLTPEETAAMNDGATRARQNLARAASLTVEGNSVRVVNLTGHKLISGYPEGRRMWLNVRWYDDAGTLVAEDGAYGDLQVELDGVPTTVRTLLDPASTHVYEAHGAISQEWASQLIGLGYSPSMPVAFDSVTGTVTADLGGVAGQAPGTSQETLHFVLNNVVKSDNRIPPYGMSFDEAQARNALPVPADQYGDPGPGGIYDYFDVVALNPAVGATHAEIDLLYQPTSWEYIQFLYLANNGSVPFLASTGVELLEAWQATGMAEPEVVASATWDAPVCTPTEPSEVSCDDGVDNDCDDLVDCDDTDCGTAAVCLPPPPTDCSAAPMSDSSVPLWLLLGLVGLVFRRVRRS
jgi:MYXO-CTERM domain-containing protein